jgi:hypothetical protein
MGKASRKRSSGTFGERRQCAGCLRSRSDRQSLLAAAAAGLPRYGRDTHWLASSLLPGSPTRVSPVPSTPMWYICRRPGSDR